jgi:hypothetical protein
MGHSSPLHKCDPRYVTRRLWVYVFRNAELANNVHAHINEAVRIWKAAGIQFRPLIRPIPDHDAQRILGEKDLTLRSYLGMLDKDDEPGRTQRKKLAGIKRQPGDLAVFIVKMDGPARAVPDYFLVTMGHDLTSAKPGRTLAHEIGHLLLGEGHTGGDDSSAPTSGLMYAGNKPGGDLTDISDKDAERARERARKIPV